MGQKVNPHGLRVGVIRDWNTRWYANKKDFANFLVEDKKILKLIRRYLNAGIMENGLVKPRSEGVPQGGPLSPLLSNIMLTELDRELEKRGRKFCRYADD